MTIIIVEGPDLAGKSYAIERIGKHFNSGFMIKNNYKPRNEMDSQILYAHYWNLLSIATTSHVRNPEDLVIMDRFYPSQAVYSYLRGIDEIDHPELQKIESTCKDFDVKIIFLDTPLKILRERYHERGDEHIKIEQLENIRKRYLRFMKLTDLEVLHLNTTSEMWLTTVEKFLKR